MIFLGDGSAHPLTSRKVRQCYRFRDNCRYPRKSSVMIISERHHGKGLVPGEASREKSDTIIGPRSRQTSCCTHPTSAKSTRSLDPPIVG